ncbi:YeeE/YedE thiosulfate transporter family protein [Tepidamorphus sp. 3E244]|uniref:YeeE/YedE thiosulfate transporter family protein n=1 Tax=Tepidamorphus sp. 3E244 TaxID=3385498 RepID=UPI0038FD28D8
MTLFMLVVLGLVMGLVFGIALEKSRVMEPGVLVRQFQFTNFIMLKMFFAAVATGLVVLVVLTGLGVAELHPKAAVMGSTIVGGLLLGAGIVIAGACPGTALAQIGAGYKDAWATVAGGILGAMVYGYNIDAIEGALKIADFGKITFDQVLGMPFWLLALVVAAALGGAMVALEKWRPWRSEMAGLPGAEKITGPEGHGARAIPAE